MAVSYIAGFDGTEASRSAVRLAAALARAEDGDVIAVHVYGDASASYWIPIESPVYAEYERDLLAEAEEVVAGLDVEGVEARALLADSPARGLHELATETNAGGIAVGVTHLGRAGRIASGSLASHLLHGSPCPVLVVPEGSSTTIKSVGIAYDGSDESRAALNVAGSIAGQHDAHLVMFGCLRPLVVPVPNPMLTATQLADSEAAFRIKLEHAAASAAPPADARPLVGPPGPTLAAAATEVDLLVVGSRGYGAVGGVLLGSVSRYLVDHCERPVLAVPRHRK